MLPFTALARTFLEHCQFVIAKLDVAVEAEKAIDLQVHQRAKAAPGLSNSSTVLGLDPLVTAWRGCSMSCT